MNTKKIELTKAGSSLADYVRGVGDGAVIVTIDGRPVAALLGIGHLDWELLDIKTLPLFVTTLEAIQDKLKSGYSVSDQEARWGLAVPQYGWTEDPRFAGYVEDDEVETPTKEEVANVS
jgi:prevent-host-death family protein